MSSFRRHPGSSIQCWVRRPPTVTASGASTFRKGSERPTAAHWPSSWEDLPAGSGTEARGPAAVRAPPELRRKGQGRAHVSVWLCGVFKTPSEMPAPRT